MAILVGAPREGMTTVSYVPGPASHIDSDVQSRRR